MKFYIPEIGDAIVLQKDWTFKLYHEYRNSTLLEKLYPDEELNFWGFGSDEKFKMVTIPAGSLISIDRIYIRKGVSEYSSITFFLKKHATDKKIKGRFWAKLSDVNEIEYASIEHSKKESKLDFGQLPEYSPGKLFDCDAAAQQSKIVREEYEVVSKLGRNRECEFKIDIILNMGEKMEAYSRSSINSDFFVIDRVTYVLNDLNGKTLAKEISAAAIKKKATEFFKNKT